MDDNGPACADCGVSWEGVTWAAAFQAWLCPEHSELRAVKLLDNMPRPVPAKRQP